MFNDCCEFNNKSLIHKVISYSCCQWGKACYHWRVTPSSPPRLGAISRAQCSSVLLLSFSWANCLIGAVASSLISVGLQARNLVSLTVVFTVICGFPLYPSKGLSSQVYIFRARSQGHLYSQLENQLSFFLSFWQESLTLGARSTAVVITRELAYYCVAYESWSRASGTLCTQVHNLC